MKKPGSTGERKRILAMKLDYQNLTQYKVITIKSNKNAINPTQL
jgi:hypothetical protein